VWLLNLFCNGILHECAIKEAVPDESCWQCQVMAGKRGRKFQASIDKLSHSIVAKNVFFVILGKKANQEPIAAKRSLDQKVESYFEGDKQLYFNKLQY